MRALWFLLSGLLANSAWAQAPRPSQVEAWSSAELALNLPKGFGAAVAPLVRLKSGPGSGPLELWELYLDAGASYAATDWLRLGVGLRGGARDFQEQAKPRMRGNLDARVRARLDRVRLSLRERYQLRVPIAGRDARHTLRSKAQVSVKLIDNVAAFAAFEPYIRLGELVKFERFRVEAGAQLAMKKRLSLEAFYRLEQPRGDPLDPRSHILAVGLATELKVRKRR